MPDSASPRNPSPAATGMASASRPMRIASVIPSMSAASFPLGAILQIADLVLDLLFGRTGADQPRHGAPVSRCREPERGHEQHRPDGNEAEKARNPQRLRNDGRGFQRGLTARSRCPGLRHDPETMPADEGKKPDQ